MLPRQHVQPEAPRSADSKLLRSFTDFRRGTSLECRQPEIISVPLEHQRICNRTFIWPPCDWYILGLTSRPPTLSNLEITFKGRRKEQFTYLDTQAWNSSFLSLGLVLDQAGSNSFSLLPQSTGLSASVRIPFEYSSRRY